MPPSREGPVFRALQFVISSHYTGDCGLQLIIIHGAVCYVVYTTGRIREAFSASLKPSAEWHCKWPLRMPLAQGDRYYCRCLAVPSSWCQPTEALYLPTGVFHTSCSLYSKSSPTSIDSHLHLHKPVNTANFALRSSQLVTQVPASSNHTVVHQCSHVQQKALGINNNSCNCNHDKQHLHLHRYNTCAIMADAVPFHTQMLNTQHDAATCIVVA